MSYLGLEFRAVARHHGSEPWVGQHLTGRRPIFGILGQQAMQEILALGRHVLDALTQNISTRIKA